MSNGDQNLRINTVNLATGAATQLERSAPDCSFAVCSGAGSPEPSTYALITLGLVGLAVKIRMSRRKARAILSE